MKVKININLEYIMKVKNLQLIKVLEKKTLLGMYQKHLGQDYTIYIYYLSNYN